MPKHKHKRKAKTWYKIKRWWRRQPTPAKLILVFLTAYFIVKSNILSFLTKVISNPGILGAYIIFLPIILLFGFLFYMIFLYFRKELRDLKK